MVRISSRRMIHMRFLTVLLSIPAAFAQSGGTITGTVSDVDGVAVANAPIQVTNKTTNEIRKATSSNTGAYTLAPLPPGTYDFSVAALGFNPYGQQNVTVGASQNNPPRCPPVRLPARHSGRRPGFQNRPPKRASHAVRAYAAD